jgi:ATP-dependent RNA helicase DeaD
MPASPTPRANVAPPAPREAEKPAPAVAMAPRVEAAPRIEAAPRTETSGAVEAPPQADREPREARERRPRRDDDRRPRRGDEPAAPRAPGQRPQRHADFVTWQPPEEEGDDQPIFTGGERKMGELPPPNPPPRRREERPREERQVERQPYVERSPMAESRNMEALGDDADFAEVYVNVGRRDGARAGDLQKILSDKGVGDKNDVRRIRVRDRNAFVSVRKTAVDRAIAALTGVTIGTRLSSAEIAREKSGGSDVDVSNLERPALSDEAPTDRKG